MKNVAILLIAACLLAIGCRTTTSSKCGPCPLMAYFAPYITIKIVDKTSGADLFLSPGSPYKFSDLKISSSTDGANVSAFVDSTDNANRFVRLLATQTQTFSLKLADLPADNINVALKLDSPVCCFVPHIRQVALNNNVVCSACGVGPAVTIKK